jgi:hypothetical protein
MVSKKNVPSSLKSQAFLKIYYKFSTGISSLKYYAYKNSPYKVGGIEGL